MVGSYAEGVVAMMANKHFLGNGAVVKNPRKPVGSLCLPMFASEVDDAVTKVSSTAGPQPACVGFVDVTPEAIGNRDADSFSHGDMITRFALIGNA